MTEIIELLFLLRIISCHLVSSCLGLEIIICYIDGKKYVEVAEEMQISIASVKKHMVKALKKVREIKKRLKQ
jgi:hypothetical protein